ncbi:T6SS immunity protein Tli4 family protein [Providencia rettgeri]|nr:T6SS immunity protein Tli4 family protein [Providencia rettgeri]MDK7743210.1 T6SS immunity protein Tli4 family protein [Providencia rettgeri]MDK7756052.1 T6SS immunity protein Tli4 family protein [Providencia rettgeri]
MQQINHRQRSIIAFIGIVMCIGGSLTKTLAQTELADKENTVIETLFEKTKPQCIGRYVIDVPESFNNQLRNSIFIGDFKIESQFIYPPSFKQRIELREAELREWKTSAKNAPMLKAVIQLPDGKGVIFDRNKPTSNDAYRILEAHVYVNHIAFIITTDILDLSSPKYEKEKKSYEKAGFSEYEMNDKYAKLEAMQSLIARLQGRLDHEIPMEKGVCIPNGFILDDGEIPKQDVSFVYDTGEFIFSVESDNRFAGSNDTLLSRSAEINEAIRRHGRKTIRNGNLSPNNIPSQEWLVKGEQEVYSKAENKRLPDLPYYDFYFYANEHQGSLILPTLLMGMHNTNQFTTYSESEMVEIWDQIVGSLRYKPNAF